jgi:putative DNA primase/helicase
MIVDLRAMARALGGEVVAGQVLCPGPGHSSKDRTLAVRLSANAPMGFVAHSLCGQDFFLCRDHVAGLLGRAASHEFPK